MLKQLIGDHMSAFSVNSQVDGSPAKMASHLVIKAYAIALRLPVRKLEQLKIKKWSDGAPRITLSSGAIVSRTSSEIAEDVVTIFNALKIVSQAFPELVLTTRESYSVHKHEGSSEETPIYCFDEKAIADTTELGRFLALPSWMDAPYLLELVESLVREFVRMGFIIEVK